MLSFKHFLYFKKVFTLEYIYIYIIYPQQATRIVSPKYTHYLEVPKISWKISFYIFVYLYILIICFCCNSRHIIFSNLLIKCIKIHSYGSILQIKIVIFQFKTCHHNCSYMTYISHLAAAAPMFEYLKNSTYVCFQTHTAFCRHLFKYIRRLAGGMVLGTYMGFHA